MSAPSNREETIFEHALGLDSLQGRDAYLRDACGADVAMWERLQGLLAAHDRAGGFLEHKAPEPGAPTSPAAAPFVVPASGGAAAEPAEAGTPNLLIEKPGDHIGRYKLLEPIGEGGMGTVWMAEQAEPVRRRVALKIIKLGMDTRSVIARFEAERQALALMDHPNIARVFDGGATGATGAEGAEFQISNFKSQIPAGRPYFVMELVRGLPISRFCDEANLSTRQRLELFSQVCRAVQHAHQKGIIHRDLKPSNILVTVQDNRPVVKVIDFGIAKATEGRLTDKTLLTSFDQLMGTPAYMSPEQAGLGSLDIDTRSDTYSLGVVLYELLTGRPPFDTRELLKQGYDAVLRTIREVDPPKPSTTVERQWLLRVESGEPRERRTSLHSQLKLLSTTLRGDLDWIVMKCLEKDRARRYETANGLAADLERYLHDEPVLARPPSAVYRWQKFARKHRAGLTAAAGFILLLIAATAVSTVLALRANREWTRAEQATKHARKERDNAVRSGDAEREARLGEERQRKAAEAAITQAVKSEADTKAFAQFLVWDVLAVARPEGEQGGLGVNITVAKALEAAEQKLEQRFSGQPKAEALARQAIGVTWRNLGRYRSAEKHFRRALELNEREFGAAHPDSISSRNSLGVSLEEQGRGMEAASVHAQNLEFCRQTYGSHDTNTLNVMENLASGYLKAGRAKEAIPLFQEVLQSLESEAGAGHPDTLTAMNDLARAYQEAGELNKALPIFKNALTICTNRLNPNHPKTLTAMNNLAGALQENGQQDEARALFEQSLKLHEANFGPGHPKTLNARRNLAGACSRSRRFEEAISLYQQIVSIQTAKLDPDHDEVLWSKHDLAKGFVDARRFDEAESLLRSLAERGRKQGPNTRGFAEILATLGDCLLRHSKHKDSETALRESLAIWKKRDLDYWRTSRIRVLLGDSLVAQGLHLEAEPLLLQAYEGLKRSETARPSHGITQARKAAGNSILKLYEAWGRTNEAAVWREKLAAPAKSPETVHP